MAFVLVSVGLPVLGEAKSAPQVGVVVGGRAPQLEQYAAGQLCDYLQKLYGIEVKPTVGIPASAEALFLIGGPGTNGLVKKATKPRGFPKVSEQGMVLRRVEVGKRPGLIVGGGSPRATLWAVYELVERWGVRYLLHGDVLPEAGGEFRLPELDETKEPALTVRQWRVVNDFANGPESWGMADYRPLLDQLAKMKFNRLFLSLYPWQPFLDYEVRGIKRRSAWLWYDYHFPITDTMIGRNLFGQASEFWNPDLPIHGSYKEFSAAGEQLIHNLMKAAHERGMECVASFGTSLLEFPPEFAPLLKDPQKVKQLGELDVVPGPKTSMDDPVLFEMSSAVLRAVVNTYPEADQITFSVPEWRQWTDQYERAWADLDAKYGLSKVKSLAEVIAAANARKDYPGGAERAVREVKGDIASLYYIDRLLGDPKVLAGTRRPDMKFVYDFVAEELYPVLDRILPPGSTILNLVDYTPSRILRRRGVLQNIPNRKLSSALIFTLEDDNIGMVPQLTTGSLHQLTQDLLRYGWAGFSTRYWVVGGQDSNVAYLARAAWDRTATPEAVDRDQLRAVCGEGCVAEMMKVYQEVQAVTVNLEWNHLTFAFAVPRMMLMHWKPEPMSADLVEDRQGYERALAAAKSALANATPGGRGYVEYWIGRLDFAVEYINAADAMYRAAQAEANKDRAGTLREAEQGLAALRRGIEAYARVARDQSDRGAIAILNEFAYRPLKAKVAALPR